MKAKNAEQFAERNRQFVAKWKHRLCGTVKTREDGRFYDDTWASTGNGSYIDLNGVHGEWYERLDRFLEEMKTHCPGFKIFQLKLKFGQVKIYLEDHQGFQVDADKLSEELNDPKLIW
jgi:hypothetical protein